MVQEQAMLRWRLTGLRVHFSLGSRWRQTPSVGRGAETPLARDLGV